MLDALSVWVRNMYIYLGREKTRYIPNYRGTILSIPNRSWREILQKPYRVWGLLIGNDRDNEHGWLVALVTSVI